MEFNCQILHPKHHTRYIKRNEEEEEEEEEDKEEEDKEEEKGKRQKGTLYFKKVRSL